MIKIEDILEDNGYDIDLLTEKETILFRNPDYVTAVVSITDDYHAVYDYDKMIQFLVETDGMTYDEAMEFIDYNTIRALSYCNGKNQLSYICF